MFLVFFNDTATTEIYTLSLHDALPISPPHLLAIDEDRSLHPLYQDLFAEAGFQVTAFPPPVPITEVQRLQPRSEEHTSELQSRQYIVCRLLLEKKHSTTNLRR